MSLRDLLLYKEEYNRPVVFGIDWSSEISPDDNYAVGIGIRGFLFAASFSGKFYICTSVEHGWRIKGDYDQINSEIAAMKRNFQDGVDTIYGKIVSLGVTPSGGKTPNACAASIQTIYDLQYDNGYDDGYNAGKKAGQNESKGYAKTQQYTGGNGWCNAGVTMTVNLTGCAWYKNATQNNIKCGISSVSGHGNTDDALKIETYCQAYNASNGVATVYIRGDVKNPTILVCVI